MSVRIAVVGAGGVAARHVRVLSGFDDARVVAVADPVPAAAGGWPPTAAPTAYPDADRAARPRGLDAVYVCVPPFAHGAPEQAVARAAACRCSWRSRSAADLATAERARRRGRRDAGVVTGTGYHWRLPGHRRAGRASCSRPRRPGWSHGAWLDKVPPPAWWPRGTRSGGQVVEQADPRARPGPACWSARSSEVSARRPAAPTAATGDVDDVTAATLPLRLAARSAR